MALNSIGCIRLSSNKSISRFRFENGCLSHAIHDQKQKLQHLSFYWIFTKIHKIGTFFCLLLIWKKRKKIYRCFAPGLAHRRELSTLSSSESEMEEKEKDTLAFRKYREPLDSLSLSATLYFCFSLCSLHAVIPGGSWPEYLSMQSSYYRIYSI